MVLEIGLIEMLLTFLAGGVFALVLRRPRYMPVQPNLVESLLRAAAGGAKIKLTRAPSSVQREGGTQEVEFMLELDLTEMNKRIKQLRMYNGTSGALKAARLAKRTLGMSMEDAVEHINDQ